MTCSPANANVAQALDRVRPPKALCGYTAVCSETQRLLRIVGCRSYALRIGTDLGGDDEASLRLRAMIVRDAQLRAAAAQNVLQWELTGATEAQVAAVASMLTSLLDPDGAPIGLQLLFAFLRELHKHTLREADLHVCWRWDAHMGDSKYKLVWVMGTLAYALIGELCEQGLLADVDAIPCPKEGDNNMCYVRNPESVFVSLHPCMHYMSMPGVERLYAEADREDTIARCPCCDEMIFFARRAFRPREGPPARLQPPVSPARLATPVCVAIGEAAVVEAEVDEV